jgi:hypothetical protein
VSRPAPARSGLQRARALVLAHGWNAVAYQILNPGIRHWFAGAGDAVVGYAMYAGTRVVAGAPVCAADRVAAVAARVRRRRAARGERVCTSAPATASRRASPPRARTPLCRGRAAVVGPARVGRARVRSAAAQLNRRATRACASPSGGRRARAHPALRAVLAAWLAAAGCRRCTSSSSPRPRPRSPTAGCSSPARRGGGRPAGAVAFLVATPVPARGGVAARAVAARPDAPNGTVELLADAAMRALAAGRRAGRDDGARAALAPRAPRGARPPPAWLALARGGRARTGGASTTSAGSTRSRPSSAPTPWEAIAAIADGPAVHAAGAVGHRRARSARVAAALVARALGDGGRRRGARAARARRAGAAAGAARRRAGARWPPTCASAAHDRPPPPRARPGAPVGAPAARRAAGRGAAPRRRPSATVLALAAFVLGVGLGAAASATGSPALAAAVRLVEPLGALWVNAIRMTIVPLVVSLLVTSVAGVADVRSVGRLGARALALFLGLLTLSALVAALAGPPLFAGTPLDPAGAEALRAKAAAAAAAAGQARPELPTLRGFVVGLVPTNPVQAAAEGAMLPLIVFTVVFAAAVTRLPAEPRAALTGFFRAVSQAMLVVVGWVLRFTRSACSPSPPARGSSSASAPPARSATTWWSPAGSSPSWRSRATRGDAARAHPAAHVRARGRAGAGGGHQLAVVARVAAGAHRRRARGVRAPARSSKGSCCRSR